MEAQWQSDEELRIEKEALQRAQTNNLLEEMYLPT